MCTSERNLILAISSSYVHMMQKLIISHLQLRQQHLITMRRIFFKRIAQRINQNYEEHAKRNADILINFMCKIPKMKVRKIWMKNRSRYWWNRLKNSNFEDEFIHNFRMDRNSFRYICDKLSHELSAHPCAVREALPVDLKVAIALYKLASCAEYRVVANQFGVHKSTVQKCLYNFCNAVIKVLLKEEVTIPRGNDARAIICGFQKKSGIPQIMGALDGTHIPVTPPSNGSADYINRKGWPSVVLQALVDCNYMFMDIACKHPGSAHDATVLKDSFLFKNIDRQELPKENVNGKDISAFFIGDPAYPLLPWLMKGYHGVLTPEEDSFNAYLNKARIVVENAFGRLKGRWRILQKRIDIDVNFVPQVVATCCVLHNILERRKVPYNDLWNESVQVNDSLLIQPSFESQIYSLQGEEIRNHLKEYMSRNFPQIRSRKN